MHKMFVNVRRIISTNGLKNISIDPSIATNSSLNCNIPQYFSASEKFFSCYDVLFELKWPLHTTEILLAFFIVLFNALVMVILIKKSTKLNLFDKIMICHCIVDGLTGLLDVPFFHFSSVFGYWPFGNVSALLWTTFDNALNVITNLHMLYLTWARLRSITAPNSFEKEILIQKPIMISVIIWMSGLIYWGIIVGIFGLYSFTTNINFNPIYLEVILIFVSWFLPLLGIIIFGLYIIYILNMRRKKKRGINDRAKQISCLSSKIGHGSKQATGSDSIVLKSNKKEPSLLSYFKNGFKLDVQAKFQIMIISYWIQWLPSCIIAMVDPICGCVPSNVSSGIYWLTYTVCLSDPFVILLLNPNIKIRKKKSRVAPG